MPEWGGLAFDANGDLDASIDVTVDLATRGTGTPVAKFNGGSITVDDVIDADPSDYEADHSYLWAWQDKLEAAIRARMFAPFLGVREDPATGSAAAALAGVLTAHGGLGAGAQVHESLVVPIKRN
mgnify:CR=1 FL=1